MRLYQKENQTNITNNNNKRKCHIEYTEERGMSMKYVFLYTREIYGYKTHRRETDEY